MDLWLFSDHLGSIRLVTHATPWGDVVEFNEYTPFGSEWTPDVLGTEQKLRFTGHERDLMDPTHTTDDLDYMHARHYNLNLARFLSVDPAPANLSRPQSWNAYAYVLNNPLKFTDPSGMVDHDPSSDCDDGAGGDSTCGDLERAWWKNFLSESHKNEAALDTHFEGVIAGISSAGDNKKSRWVTAPTPQNYWDWYWDSVGSNSDFSLNFSLLYLGWTSSLDSGLLELDFSETKNINFMDIGVDVGITLLSPDSRRAQGGYLEIKVGHPLKPVSFGVLLNRSPVRPIGMTVHAGYGLFLPPQVTWNP